MSIEWCAPLGLDLLRRAFPDGYLPRRGHATVGGFFCVYAAGTQAKYIDPEATQKGGFNLNDPVHGQWFLAHHPTALLPLPDRSDEPSWACLVAELGARTWPNARVQYRFDRGVCGSWVLYAYPTGGRDGSGWASWSIDTEDPEEALITALSLSLSPR